MFSWEKFCIIMQKVAETVRRSWENEMLLSHDLLTNISKIYYDFRRFLKIRLNESCFVLFRLVKVKVGFIVKYPYLFNWLHKYLPWYWNSFVPVPSLIAPQAACHSHSIFLVPPGTHLYSWVDRSTFRVRNLLKVFACASGGYGTPDPWIWKQML